MDTPQLPTHLRIWLYDDGPPPMDPVPNSLCIIARGLREPLTDANGQVTCRECLAIMERYLL